MAEQQEERYSEPEYVYEVRSNQPLSVWLGANERVQIFHSTTLPNLEVVGGYEVGDNLGILDAEAQTTIMIRLLEVKR